MLQQVKKQKSFISSYIFPSFNNKPHKITLLEQHFYLINHSWISQSAHYLQYQVF